jgi:hypothetical protein
VRERAEHERAEHEQPYDGSTQDYYARISAAIRGISIVATHETEGRTRSACQPANMRNSPSDLGGAAGC